MLSGPDLEYVTQLLLRTAAIRIDATQEYLVRSRLEPLAKQAGLPDLSALVEQLRQRPFGDLHTRVVEAMTTNETSFFRDHHPFDTLKTLIIPELVQRKADRTLRIWSAACSTGQEPYSLAMLLADTLQLNGWRIQIVASDLARSPLEKAQTGVYTALDVGRGLPARALARHFDRVGTSFQVKPHLRGMIEWRQMNLGAPWPPLPVFDVIFMRNVLIYFEPSSVLQVLKRARGNLQSHGALFLGNTENMLGLDAGFESKMNGKTIYYRPSAGRK
jgi:chemotaxis protein methyltransferase CheR